MRRAPLTLTLVVLVLSAAVAAPATASNATRNEALAAWGAVQQDVQVPAGWTGSTQTCEVGEESQESLTATLRTVNTLRDFAGLGPVTFDPALNHKALEAALIMAAQNDLSHDPPPDWKCWSQEGHDAAGSSNLALGISGAGAILAYAEDDRTESLGHRRWVLDPAATTFGSGSTGASNALWIFGPNPAPVAANTTVAWPAADWVPRALVPPVWSVTVGGDNQQVEFSSPKVTLTLDGQAVAVSEVTDLGTGFGSGRTLSWTPDPQLRSELATGDHVVGVTVEGIVADGQALPLSYKVKPFEPTDPARFVSRPRIARRGGGHKPIRKGTGLVVRAKVTPSGAKRSYRWRRDGHRIRGAKKKTYRARRADRGHKLSCRVTASIPGVGKATRTTRSVRVKR